MNNLENAKELIKKGEYEKARSIMDIINDNIDKTDYLFEKTRILLNVEEYNNLVFDVKKCTEKIIFASNESDLQWMIFEILKIVCDNKICNKSKYTEEFISFLENNITYLELKYKMVLKIKMIEYFYDNSNYLKSFEYIIDLIESVVTNIEYKLIDILNISLRKLDYAVIDKKNIIKKIESANKKIKNIKIKNILLNELEILENKVCLKSRPECLHVNLTNRCNLRCIMCHNEHVKHYDIDNKLVEFIKENMPYLCYVSWLGGEVFISDIFDELSRLAVKHNVKQRITTNALLLDEEKIRFIIDNNIDLKISIDAVTKDLYEKIRLGGSFDKLTRNLKMIKEYNKNVNGKKYIYNTMASTIMSLNRNTIKDMVEFAIRYGFNAIDFQKCRIMQGTENLGLNINQQNEIAFEIETLKEEIKHRKESIEINTDFVINEKNSSISVINQVRNNENDEIQKKFCVAPWKLLCIEKNEIYFSCICDKINISDCMQDDVWNCRGIVELRKKILNNKLPNCCDIDCRNTQDFGKKIRLGMI